MLTITADELPRFMRCNGSVNMPAAFPNVDLDTTYRDEGTAAHYMAAAVFRNDFTVEEIVDRKAPNGFYMSGDMAEHVSQYLMALDCGDVEIDTSFTVENVFAINGRADHIKLRLDLDTLTIDDLKYGFTIVEPEMNWTLISHALGFIFRNAIAPPANIVFRIHQPRAYHPDGKLREWRITGEQLMQLYSELYAALAQPSDVLNTGPQCRKCHALANCPAARAASLNAIDCTSVRYSEDIPSDALSYELDLLHTAQATLKNRLDALQNLALHRLRHGQVIENYASVTGYGNRTWKEGLTPDFLSAITGKDLRKPGVVTPAQAERLGVSETVVKSLTHRPTTGTRLERVSATKQAQRLLNRETEK